ncbi:MAG: prepilin-type N-terminal cleavage/methylation domain-containing protein [Luteolibacter sp.]
MRNRRRTSGITLVEILVVIVIIAVLATLSTMGVRRMKLAAAKTQTINQLRQINVAVNMWAGEKNLGEPMYAANGTGDFGHEGFPGANAVICPGNPAKALFNPQSPDDGYLTDHSVFFSPLAKMKAPQRRDYKPDDTSPAHPWGTYAWHYPANVAGSLTSRQDNAMGGAWAVTSIGTGAKGKLLMANEYTNSDPIWDKQYLALLIDGSVSLVAQNEPGWKKWAWNQ